MDTNAYTKKAGDEFQSLFHTYNACMQRTLTKYGLYPGQPQILFAIKELGAPTQNELAAAAEVSKASVGVSLRRLEKSGFVKRVRDRKDTRCIRVSLTQKGTEYARWCEIDFDVIFSTMFEGLTGDGREDAYAIAKQMNQSLTALKQRLDS